MSRISQAIMAAGIAGAALAISAATAHADVDARIYERYGTIGDHSVTAYTTALADVSMYGSAAVNEALAYQVCAMRASGDSEQYIANALSAYTGQQATVIVRGATFHFCPEF